MLRLRVWISKSRTERGGKWRVRLSLRVRMKAPCFHFDSGLHAARPTNPHVRATSDSRPNTSASDPCSWLTRIESPR
jgi:hypothetical protein